MGYILILKGGYSRLGAISRSLGDEMNVPIGNALPKRSANT